MGIEATKHYVKKAAKLLDISERLEKILTRPYRQVKTEIIVELDNGQITTFMGYRVQHNKDLGPMKGGLRYHTSVNQEEVESLASLMTWKTALLKLPFGGAKGGIYCDPSQLSESEVERITKTYIENIKEIIGPYIDIPAPDMNTNSQTMAWILAQYSKYYGFNPGVVTGKPVFLYGSECRESATGYGVVFCLELILKAQQKTIENCRCVVQGFGNVGYHTANFLYEKKAKVIAVSDVSGGMLNPNGLNIPELKAYADQHGTISGYSDGQTISNDDLLQLECDALIPCALGDIFDKETANNVNCRYIVEGANGPTLPEADEVFKKKNIIVVPDILANAGGVTVSYFEWAENIQQFQWKREAVIQELQLYLTNAFERVIEVAKVKQCSLRTAAYIIGMGRVIKAKLTLGL